MLIRSQTTDGDGAGLTRRATYPCLSFPPSSMGDRSCVGLCSGLGDPFVLWAFSSFPSSAAVVVLAAAGSAGSAGSADSAGARRAGLQ